jgi:hypothetical protein
MMSILDRTLPVDRPSVALRRLLRPAVGFRHPSEVLRDPGLEPEEMRRILASWASDASAVENRPTLRWLLGTPEPVALTEVLDALARLDRLEIGHGDRRH